MRPLLRSLSASSDVLSQDTELGSPHADLLPLGHESVALDKLLPLPDRQQLAEAAAGLLLWDEDDEEEEKRLRGGGPEGDWDMVMAARRRSDGDRQRREGSLWDSRTGAGGGTRRGGWLYKTLPAAPSSAPPTVALPLAYEHTSPRSAGIRAVSIFDHKRLIRF